MKNVEIAKELDLLHFVCGRKEFFVKDGKGMSLYTDGFSREVFDKEWPEFMKHPCDPVMCEAFEGGEYFTFSIHEDVIRVFTKDCTKGSRLSKGHDAWIVNFTPDHYNRENIKVCDTLDEAVAAIKSFLNP